MIKKQLTREDAKEAMDDMVRTVSGWRDSFIPIENARAMAAVGVANGLKMEPHAPFERKVQAMLRAFSIVDRVYAEIPDGDVR